MKLNEILCNMFQVNKEFPLLMRTLQIKDSKGSGFIHLSVFHQVLNYFVMPMSYQLFKDILRRYFFVFFHNETNFFWCILFCLRIIIFYFTHIFHLVYYIKFILHSVIIFINFRMKIFAVFRRYLFAWQNFNEGIFISFLFHFMHDV